MKEGETSPGLQITAFIGVAAAVRPGQVSKMGDGLGEAFRNPVLITVEVYKVVPVFICEMLGDMLALAWDCQFARLASRIGRSIKLKQTKMKLFAPSFLVFW